MQLAEPNTPLTLADGTQIDPLTGRVIGVPEEERQKFVQVPNNRQLREEYASVQRRLVDLPLPTEKMNGLSVILTYKLIGLSDDDIVIATGLSTQQIGTLVMSDAFVDMKRMIIETIMAADTEDIRIALKGNASMAVQRLQQLINSDDEKVALFASKDALDRDGHRPADVIELKHKLEGGLTIEVIRRDHSQQIPTVDVEFKQIEDKGDDDYGY